ncbi:MAG TPA: hypothetical protein VIU12_14230 [Chryseolinea sp.]
MAKKITDATVHQKKVLSKELSYWSKKWKVTGRQIGGAKRAVESDSISKIEKYLRKTGKIK